MLTQLQNFANKADFTKNCFDFLGHLHYKSQKTNNFINWNTIQESISTPKTQKEKEVLPYVQSASFLLQMQDEDILKALDNENEIFASTNNPFDKNQFQSYLFFGVKLQDKSEYRREDIATLTRYINKAFLIPVFIIYQYDNKVSIGVINRRINKNDNAKDVLEKVTLIKDIDIQNPKRSHLDILEDLNLKNIKKFEKTNDFSALHKAWTRVLSISELNKRFYEEIKNWYFWASKTVKFPQINPKNPKNNDEYQEESVLRLLTRLLFCWFLKEKDFIKNETFAEKHLQNILKDFEPESQTQGSFYNAVLQNLFFATLNVPIDKRTYYAPKIKNDKNVYDKNAYGNQNIYRYAEMFRDESQIKPFFENVPFLNGGLFECLDQKKDDNNNITKEIRLDGFSVKTEKRAFLPNELFFAQHKDIDLSKEFEGDKKMKNVKVSGLINILNKYKFTVEENTPTDQDVALDPEMLGQIFESLLAFHNPETKQVARKTTGSFYTPKEIVQYMTEEAVKAFLLNLTKDNTRFATQQNIQDDFEILVNDAHDKSPFGEKQNEFLLENIYKNLKTFDPACGSGAFPMGMLDKLVKIVRKLDKQNLAFSKIVKQPFETTKQNIINDLQQDKQTAQHIRNPQAKEKALQELEEQIKEIENAFEKNEHKTNDYARKLYLIQNCIYGVDIQQIAVQISKLRFFIALVIEQKRDDTKDNFGVETLPNLETKIVCANTLIRLEATENNLFNDVIVEKEQELQENRDKHFKAQSQNEKAIIQQIDATLRKQIAEILQKDKNIDKENAQKLIDFDIFSQNAKADWFDAKKMFGVDGFNIIIGNPPYVQLQKMKDKQADFEKQKFQTYTKMGDIYCLFYEKGIQLLKNGGMLAYITSNKWMKAGYGEAMRNFITDKTNPLQLIDFGGVQVFESATVDTNILITQKAPNQNVLEACIVEKIAYFETKNLRVFFKQEKTHINPKNGWNIAPPIAQAIKQKIEKIGTQLKDWDIQINYGIKTGFNEAFIIDEDKKNELVAKNPNSIKIIRPILVGNSLLNYNHKKIEAYIISTFPSLKINIDDYPAIKSYFLEFGERLEQSGKQGARKKTNNKWFETQDQIKYYKEFNNPKIVWLNMNRKWKWSFVESGIYAEASLNFISSNNENTIKFLLAILSSQIHLFYFRQVGRMHDNGGFMCKIDTTKKFPIPLISQENQKPFENLVNEILGKKALGQDTQSLENEIDNLIFELYSLTEEEISFVKNKNL